MARHEAQRRGYFAKLDSPISSEKVFRLLQEPRRSIKNEGDTALDLVFQAAEVIRESEDRANAIEKRARNFAQSAMDEVKHARGQIQELEAERQAVEASMSKVSLKLEEADKALKKAILLSQPLKIG